MRHNSEAASLLFINSTFKQICLNLVLFFYEKFSEKVRILRHYLLALVESTELFKMILITCSIFFSFFFSFNGVHIDSERKEKYSM